MQSSSIQFFENLMSPNKEIREAAEKDLEKIKTLPVSESLKIFDEGMCSQNENIFQLSTLMLKKVYLDNKEKKDSLSNEEKNKLLQLLKSKIDFNKNWKNLQMNRRCFINSIRNNKFTKWIKWNNELV